MSTPTQQGAQVAPNTTTKEPSVRVVWFWFVIGMFGFGGPLAPLVASMIQAGKAKVLGLPRGKYWLPTYIAWGIYAVMFIVLLTMVTAVKHTAEFSASPAPQSAPSAAQPQQPATDTFGHQDTQCQHSVAASLNAQNKLTYAQAAQVVTSLQNMVAEGLANRRYDCYSQAYVGDVSPLQAELPMVGYTRQITGVHFGSLPAPSATYDGRELSFDYTGYPNTPQLTTYHTVYTKLVRNGGTWKFAYTSTTPNNG